MHEIILENLRPTSSILRNTNATIEPRVFILNGMIAEFVCRLIFLLTLTATIIINIFHL